MLKTRLIACLDVADGREARDVKYFGLSHAGAIDLKQALAVHSA